MINKKKVVLSSEKAHKQIAKEERYYYDSDIFKKMPPQLKPVIHKNIILKSLGKTDDEAINIRDFEFTFEKGKAIQFEYWTNSKRTKGYKSFDISSCNLSTEMFV